MRRTILVATLSALVGAVVATPVAVHASHSFNDVPDTNTFHNDIAWLANAGVTRGCNPPDNTEFCPDDEVTREQMAAFMRRFAQYLDAEDGTPAEADHATTADSATTADDAQTAQNAEKLDGFDASELTPRATANAMTDAPDGEDLTLSAEITAPAPGILIMSGTVDAGSPDSDDEAYFCKLRVDGSDVPATRMWSRIDAAQNVNHDENCTTTGTIPVDAGAHTLDLLVGAIDAETGMQSASVWGLWVPFDGTGAVPASITQLDE